MVKFFLYVDKNIALLVTKTYSEPIFLSRNASHASATDYALIILSVSVTR